MVFTEPLSNKYRTTKSNKANDQLAFIQHPSFYHFYC